MIDIWGIKVQFPIRLGVFSPWYQEWLLTSVYWWLFTMGKAAGISAQPLTSVWI
jgi:hypothetical protein